METGEIINRVEKSGLITLSLEDYYPKGERKTLDIAPFLYEGIMLRETFFRGQLASHDWEQYRGTYVNVICSEDTIIPQWAYMLLGSSLAGIAQKVVFGTPEMLEAQLFEEAFDKIDFSQWSGKRIILKGCSKLPVPPQAFLSFTQRLKPYAKSVMYGEACSTVPVFKAASGK